MANSLYTTRRVVLPEPLLERIALLLKRQGIHELKAHYLVDLCMDRAASFDTGSLYVSGITEYLQCIEIMFSQKVETVSFCLKPDYWEKIVSIQNKHNIGTGDIIRLILGSYLFTSGKTALPLTELAEIFISGRKAYQFNLLLTKPTDTLFKEKNKLYPNLNREVVFRSSSYCFEKGIISFPDSIPHERYSIDNMTTGWSKITVNGSLRMKKFFLGKKEKTGKTLGILMAHTLYSFLKGF
jgi:hypothetical protein